ncbi:MAG: T9SS type A sorting domain-containing protein [Gemmatimonadetes bacterium]|nr:T9SS type A sorting domain-containing protein [Gemmatimonadota bacterium]MBT7863465.1 T9SS type A sorting domain-containing protein [Gemmatimonadota bacterium]
MIHSFHRRWPIRRMTRAVIHTVGCLVGALVVWPLSGDATEWFWPDTALLNAPSPRQNAAGIYDPIRDRVIIFGGRSSSGDLDDVWELELSRLYWSQLPTTGSAPSPRHTHNAVYDERTNEMLIWSGRSIDANGSQLHNDVHALDLATLSWRQIEPSTDPPVARYGTAAVFDAVSGEMVNFAGFTERGRFDDTWRLNPATGAWREVVTDERPGQRCLHAGALDAKGDRMIIFGGQRGNDALDDAWSLDLRTDTWRSLPSLPAGGRRFPAVAFDARSGQFLTFGGERDGERFSDLWALTFDAPADPSKARWHMMGEQGAGPVARDRAVLIYDTKRHRLVLFGGTGTSGHLNDTWTFSLPTPTAILTPDGPEPTSLALSSIYPNPFNGQVRIQVRVPGSQRAKVEIFDLLGRRIRRLPWVAGMTTITWDATAEDGQPVATGVYLVRLQAAESSVCRSVALIR